MNILIAIDSFKGALSSQEAGRAVERGILKLGKDTTVVCRVADGGEGSCDALAAAAGGVWKPYCCTDAFHQVCEVRVLLFTKNGKTAAAIEAASIFGLHGHKVDRTTVKQTSTYGLGVLMKKLREDGIKDIIIFMGGTITSDGGLGMLQALGVRMFDEQGVELGSNENPLLRFHHLDKESLKSVQDSWKNIQLNIGCDVHNPLYGPDGCAFTFAAQKGADPDQIKQIDHQLRLVEQEVSLDLNQIYHGSGGGCAAGLCIINATLTSGFTVLNSYLKLEERIPDMDLVITGEGKIDSQSLQGKLPVRIAQMANDAKVPVVALCGQKDSDTGKLMDYFQGIYAIQMSPCTLQEAVTNTALHLEESAFQLLHLLHRFRNR